MSNNLLKPLLFVLGFLLILQIFSGNKASGPKDDFMLSGKSKVTIGKDVTIGIQNNTTSDISLPANCPKNPLTVEIFRNGEWITKEATTEAECTPESQLVLSAGKTLSVSYHKWNWQLFDEEGRYRISMKVTLDDKEKEYYHELDISKPGFLWSLWNETFHKPILNTLIYLVSVIPHKNLGWGIILLTLLIKILLLGPNHKALKAQRQMQQVQPQLDALKLKYKDQPQKLAEETMQIWKKYKVSPMNSCLPMLIQFPVLIALFYVVKDGLGSINPAFLYTRFASFDLTAIDPTFLGLIDLTKANPIVLPIIIGSLQFAQMKLSLGKVKNQPSDSPMAGMSKMMIYFMPLMIAVFTASVPAAVGLYWGTSTLFGIGQQLVVNKMRD
jgi:YidC/Oxa1 family membrane protein insertase